MTPSPIRNGCKKRKRTLIPGENENALALYADNANKRIKTSESSSPQHRSNEFNFFLQLPICVFKYLCQWLDGDDILRLVHCGCRDVSARIYAHVDKLVFGGKYTLWSGIQLARELLPFAAHLRHLEIDVARWPDRDCPIISFEKLEHLGVVHNDVDDTSSYWPMINFINPLPKTLKTLDLGGWKYSVFSLVCVPFPPLGRLSNLEGLLLPQVGTWQNFVIPSIPSSVTNLNLIADD